MPKKQPKNAFYFYMLDFKEEQKKKGINYANLAEVATAAGPIWRDAPPAVRSKFEAKAKKEKQKWQVPEQKYTSTGVSFAIIEQQERELREAEETERQDIKNIVKLKGFNKEDLLREDFYLIDVNWFCQVGGEYLIAESTLLRFNVYEGIKDYYHEMLNPGSIPVGYALDVKLACNDYGLEMPRENEKRSNYMKILANIIDYLKKQDGNVKSLPPLFTMPNKVAPVQNFIQQMCNRAAEDDTLFRVYKLETLFFHLINTLKSHSDEGFPKESLALLQLKKDQFQFTPGLGCEYHESTDKSVQCTTSRTKRWAYTVLDGCCPVAGVEVRPGRHLPSDYDVDRILTFREQRRVRAGPSVAGALADASSSTLNISFNDSSATNSSLDYYSVKQERKRSHEPLRMPKSNLSNNFRPAPELTETNFPQLGLGHGRGRGLSSSLNKMNIGK